MNFLQSGQVSSSDWLTRMRLYDSIGTQNPDKLQSTFSNIGTSVHQHQKHQQRVNNSVIMLNNENFYFLYFAFAEQDRNYFKEEKPDLKGYKINLDQSWNPVDNYIYGRAVQSIYNQHRKEDNLKKNERYLSNNNKHRINDDLTSKTRNRSEKNYSNQQHRKLLGEFIDNENPRL